jgi:hypothetical protein
VLVLTGQVFPPAGTALLVVLGVELLVWGLTAREDGILLTGGVLVGIGTGIVLAAGPLLGDDPQVIGGAFVLSMGAGFGLFALLAQTWLGLPRRWAWITAAALGTVGVGLLAGGTVLSDLATWGLPAVLLTAGLIAAVRWLRAGR